MPQPVWMEPLSRFLGAATGQAESGKRGPGGLQHAWPAVFPVALADGESCASCGSPSRRIYDDSRDT